ncbi:hypothetical protein F4779DRAFT_567203 [Xylariaceae sp. FL0662B]|nr:hypothetical protein F4779DRAFT_567203 [Xylariaceae sp. FL0662B]
MEDSNTREAQPRRGPRLYHKKSRAGCTRCKQRRVKCDEDRPSCGSCRRHRVECVYNGKVSSNAAEGSASTSRAGSRSSVHSADAPTSTGLRTTATTGKALTQPTTSALESRNKDIPAQSLYNSISSPSPGSSHPTLVNDDTDADIDLPEGSWRRIWELRLLHNQYNTRIPQPYYTPQICDIIHMWSSDIPEMAMSMAQRHNRCSLLYITFAHSALNLWTRTTDEKERDELIRLQQTYQLMSSKDQRRDIEELSRGISQNAEYVCFSSLKMLSHSLALVQTLSVDPWEPPTQWLHMGHGAGKVFGMASSLIDSASNSKIAMYVNSPPVMRDPKDTILSDHSPLDWLLAHPGDPGLIAEQADQELYDEEVLAVYKKALAYTCSVQRAIDAGELDYAIVRRFGGFAVWVPTEFTRFIEERRPRAMVILAHFMSLWLNYEHIWLIGKAGEGQIRGIYENLPLEWRCKLQGLFAKFKQPEVNHKPELTGESVDAN